MTETVNLAAIAEKERKDVDNLNQLSIYLSYDRTDNHIKQNISNMLFQALAQYRNRQNFYTFWNEINDVFNTLQTYECLYNDGEFETTYKALKSLERFPALEENANLRIQKIEQDRIEQANRWAEPRVEHCIAVGTNALSGYWSSQVKPVTIINGPTAIPMTKKTTRSGKTY